ncbi:uncharacterized protein F5147DRAFT_782528 [Suillus discolor]|uniref:Uncharacterized protein n=1 Tax=Suillus discolor TaxID=1912936 RepID=A0A9P7JLA1_9AGAM|nr:uncharacterized protein F5147DRAFT_782528 [Suillus discolor]KAG2084326.1 hypothetical protein F5147DRAFT_782528 [Suillus discolor]
MNAIYMGLTPFDAGDLFDEFFSGSVTPTRAPALPTPAPALLDSPRGGAPPAPRKTAVWTAMTPPPGAMTPPWHYDPTPGLDGLVPDPWRLYASWSP